LHKQKPDLVLIMFEKLHERSKFHGEHKDCTVKMTAQVLRTSYEDAWNLLKSLGRPTRKGFYPDNIIRKLKGMGLRIEWKSFNGIKSIKAFERMRLKGRYIIVTSNHTLYHEDGTTHDWSAGRQHHVTDIYEVNGEAHADLINPECDTLRLTPSDVRVLSKPVRKRSSSFCWEIVHAIDGTVVSRFKRKPTSKIKALLAGRLYSLADRSARLQIRSTNGSRVVYNDGRN